MAKELGVKKIAMPTNGNAGSALAAYGSRAGMETIVFCPDDTPKCNMNEIALQGARLYKVNGLITDCGKLESRRGSKALVGSIAQLSKNHTESRERKLWGSNWQSN